MLGQFKWVYAFFSVLGGLCADRISRRWTIAASLFAWSAITWWTGQVTSYNELLWARSLMGVSEAFYIPAALALIADYHQGSSRSKAVGLHQSAIYLGTIAGGFGGYAATYLGWREAFAACGLFGMLYALPLATILRDHSSTNTERLDSEPLGSNLQPAIEAAPILRTNLPTSFLHFYRDHPSCSWSLISPSLQWPAGSSEIGCPRSFAIASN
jgi:MFS family permease